MKSLFVFFIYVCSTLALVAQTQESLSKFDPARNPFDDLKAAVDSAKQINKRVILDVGGEWCFGVIELMLLCTTPKK